MSIKKQSVSPPPQTTTATYLEFIRGALPLVYLVIALLALRWTVIEPYVVPTPSMEPTLKPGDRLYALKCAYDLRFPFTDWILFRTGKVQRGDVILFKAPHDPKVTYVKRAIGIAGDKISFQDGKIFVNGTEVLKVLQKDRSLLYDVDRKDEKELYIEDLSQKKHWVILDTSFPQNRNFEEITVPPDMIFASGDNRDNSYDSRAWSSELRFVPVDYLKGRAMFIWFSSWEWRVRPERIGSLIQ